MTRDVLPAPDPAPPRLTAWPLPPYRYVPGVQAHPGHDVGHLPAVLGDDRLRWGLDLLRQRYLWEAHEVWEGAWHDTPPGPARDGLQGCIQVAATLLLRHLGREHAMVTQADRARRHLTAAIDAGTWVGGLDPRAMRAALDRALGEGGWPELDAVWRPG